jgi:hypothetical protein
MDQAERLAGFKALTESRKTGWCHYEEQDGSRKLWHELSAEGRLHYIVGDAAYYDVSFEQFVGVLREFVASTAIEEAALRLVLQSGRELHDLEKLFPDDRGTESLPLVERVREHLNALPRAHENEVWPTPAEQATLFKEMWADEAAAKREDAHRYGNDASQGVMDAKLEVLRPDQERESGRGR